VWVLLLITLSFGTNDFIAEVKNVRGIKVFFSERACNQVRQEFWIEAKRQRIKVPDEVNVGCVEIKKREV